jgi:hypothetical protein
MHKPSNNQNRLARETSPYLLQHADNPVDWYPWGEEALSAARDVGKPVLLSVGYSACHWCHVMAHESFEDDETAALMNRLFVNIKVDREERPDIDRIYQTAHQLLTQRPGGWPLTMFLDPDTQRPFFGGTYFPKEARYGMPSFGDLLTRVAGYYHENRREVRDQGLELQGLLGRLAPGQGERDRLPDAALLQAGQQQMERAFDREYGGFGSAPKFPQPSGLERLLRHWAGTANGDRPDLEALTMVSLTLTRMAEGGLYDQLGGGFYRYSVDRRWQIPHFEKMLYDNGPLLALYAEAALATGEPLFRRIALETADWLLSDMRSPDGAFYASRDADSEGREGEYYVWTPGEARDLLPDAQYTPLSRHLGLQEDANFEGRWHLSVREPLEEIAGDLACSEETLRKDIDAARVTLLAARAARIPPARDEKILAAWNGLAIRGLAVAGKALRQPELVAAAAAAVDFIAERMRRDGRLLAVYKDGQARFPAYLDDHAFLLDALLYVLQCDWQNRHLQFAIEIAEILLEHFLDPEDGGFFFTADDHEALMHRPKPLADESMPAGNGIAALALQRLGFMLGESRYLSAAESTLRFAAPSMLAYPHAHVTMLTALDEYLAHTEIVIIRGRPGRIADWRDAAAGIYAPRRMVFAIPDDAPGLPGSLALRVPIEGETVAYRCIGNQCSLPLTRWEELAALLGQQELGPVNK